MSDPENVKLAEEGLLELPAEVPEGPRLEDYDPTVAAITELQDLVLLLINATLVGKVKSVPKFKPRARPTTPVSQAMKAIEDASAEQAFWNVVSQLIPGYGPQPDSEPPD